LVVRPIPSDGLEILVIGLAEAIMARWIDHLVAAILAALDRLDPADADNVD
jgi:hypothetical protein